MKPGFTIIVCLYGFFAAACTREEPIMVENAWIRDAPPGTHMMAGYFSITNTAAGDRTIKEVESDAFVVTEIHVTRISDGTARMRRIGELDLPAGEKIVFEPGGPHLMLIRPTRDIAPGDQVTIVLVFDDGERMAVDFTVKRGASD